MERAAIFCPPDSVRIEDLPSELRERSKAPVLSASTGESEDSGNDVGFTEARDRLVEDFERRYLTGLLTRHQGNVSQAAREADLHRQSLQKMLRRLEIDPQRFRGGS